MLNHGGVCLCTGGGEVSANGLWAFEIHIARLFVDVVLKATMWRRGTSVVVEFVESCHGFISPSHQLPFRVRDFVLWQPMALLFVLHWIHKEDFPLSRFVAFNNTPTYNLAK